MEIVCTILHQWPYMEMTNYNILRLLLAGELYLNAGYYANHPHFKLPFAETHFSQHGIFALALSSDYKDVRNKESIVRQEAIATCTPNKWGAFLQIMSLSSVLERHYSLSTLWYTNL